MNNPLEWLSQYDETDLRKAFRDEEYSSFSDYYSDYADSYDFDVWYEYLLSLSPLSPFSPLLPLPPLILPTTTPNPTPN